MPPLAHLPGRNRYAPPHTARTLSCRVVQSSRFNLNRPGLSTPFHKYDHVCGEGFLAQTRRERRAYPSGSVRSEQRRLGQKEPPPGGLRRFSVLSSLCLAHCPTSGDAPSSRLARTEKRRNKRGRIYGTGYLIAVSEWKSSLESCGLVQRKPSRRSIGKRSSWRASTPFLP